ncbi:MAG: YARHG domain-containing protein [Methyloligella sp. ZOD6]
MRLYVAILGVCLTLGGLALSATPASAYTCSELWWLRNQIFHANGYCFKSRRGINTFGNAGCLYDDAGSMPMSQTDRNAIANVQRQERLQGCR